MSIILAHSEVLLGQNHRNLNCVSMHIFGVQNKKICIETQFKFLWFWSSKTSLWDSMMLILAAREILYTGHLIFMHTSGIKQPCFFLCIVIMICIFMGLPQCRLPQHIEFDRLNVYTVLMNLEEPSTRSYTPPTPTPTPHTPPG